RGAGLALLGVEPPEDVQAEEAVLTARELDDQTQGDPVGAVAEDLVPFAAQDGVEEDATEGDPGAALVAEGVVDDQPQAQAGDEGGEELGQENATDLVPIPGGAAEEAEGGEVAVVGGAPGGRP